MTLVVARILENNVVIFSDSKVTFGEERYRPPPLLVLKTVALRPNLALAFAGDVERAQIAIATTPLAGSEEELIAHFLAAHVEHGMTDPDFILAFLDPTPHIARISQGSVENDLAAAWLGNQAAFNDLQARVAASEGELAGRLHSAFDDIVHDGGYEDIGDFMVCCQRGPDGFVYRARSGVSFSVPRTASTQTFQQIPAGTAAEGGYSWSMLTPREAGVGAIGLYFDQGRFGCLLYPRHSPKAFRIVDVDRADFVTEVRVRFGFTLGGGQSFAPVLLRM